MLVKPPHNNCEDEIRFLGGLPIDELIGDILDSQASLSQLRAGGVGLVINPIYVLERQLGRLGLIYNILSGLVKSDEVVIRGLVDGDIQAYTQFGKEYKLLRDRTPGINLISKDNLIIKPGAVNVLSAIEGVHGLFNTQREFQGSFVASRFLRRLESAMDQIHPVYVTLAHMCYTGLYNHAYGIKMAGEKKRSWFLPRNRGFTGIQGLGLDILDSIREHGTHLDVKHLGIANRLAVYKYAAEHQIPILASHVAASGLRIKDYLSLYFSGARKTFTPKLAKPFNEFFESSPTTKTLIPRNKGVFNRYFNSSQINIMDEEIIMIMKSDGLIGLSMDRRIQGNVKIKDLANNKYLDYIAPEDVTYIEQEHSAVLEQYSIDASYHMGNSATHSLTSHWIAVENAFSQNDETKFNSARADLERFCQSIIHIYQLGRSAHIQNPELHICLGSDYDGIIDALKCVKQSDKLPGFEADVVDKLNAYKTGSPDNIFAKENVDIVELVSTIFTKSAMRFLTTHFGVSVSARA